MFFEVEEGSPDKVFSLEIPKIPFAFPGKVAINSIFFFFFFFPLPLYLLAVSFYLLSSLTVISLQKGESISTWKGMESETT